MTPYLDNKVLVCDIEVEFQQRFKRMEGIVDIAIIVLRYVNNESWNTKSKPSDLLYGD